MLRWMYPVWEKVTDMLYDHVRLTDLIPVDVGEACLLGWARAWRAVALATRWTTAKLT